MGQEINQASAPATNICVFCGASPGKSETFRKTGFELGRLLAKFDVGLVYGGASVGIMGAVAEGCQSAGGFITGIIPEILATTELTKTDVDTLLVVDGMHPRKAAMMARSAGFVALPGGFGTMEELFEVLTWNQIGIVDKPVALVNLEGYYDKLLGFLDHAVEQGLLSPKHRSGLTVVNDLPSLQTQFLAPILKQG